MFQLIGYYKGPEIRKTLKEKLFRQRGELVYNVNPQLYGEGNPDCLRNFGVFELTFDAETPPEESDLERSFNQQLREAIGNGVALGTNYIPPEKIEISLEKEIA